VPRICLVQVKDLLQPLSCGSVVDVA
jgi:hypothetical protein